MKKVPMLSLLLLIFFGCNLGDSKKEPAFYTVVFNSNGGTGSMDSLSIEENKSVLLSKNLFSKEDNEFTGWNTLPDGKGSDYSDEGTILSVNSDITLYAQWKDIRFITTWYPTGVGKLIQIPLDNDGEYDFTIDWGDGTQERVTDVTTGYIDHTYNEHKEYTVIITGKCEGFGYRYISNTDRDEFRDVSQWGNVLFHNKGGLFSNTKELLSFSAEDTPDISNLTSFWRIFSGSKFNGDISKWNTGNISSMEYAFSGSDFTGDISDWNTSNVLLMGDMFSMAKFNGDISKWDTSKVISMKWMFYNADNFDCGGIDISTWNWNVDKVENNVEMFDISPLEHSKPSWYVLKSGATP